MNIALWVVQALLALLYGGAGIMKTFNTAKAKETFSWAKRHSVNFARFVGVSELLGAIGLLAPMLSGVLPWLTPLAALGLVVIQVLAIFTEHLPHKEFQAIPVNLVLLALGAFVFIGRFSLFHM